MSTWFMHDPLSLLRLINKRDKLCGLQFGTTLFPTVPGNSMMTIQFITDSIGRGPGFDITIKQIPCFNSDYEEQGVYGTPVPHGPLVIEARDPKSQDTRFFNDDLGPSHLIRNPSKIPFIHPLRTDCECPAPKIRVSFVKEAVFT